MIANYAYLDNDWLLTNFHWFLQGNNAFFKFVFTGLRDYEDVFEISPPEAQGSATATLLVKNSTALDFDRGRREYTLEVSHWA